MTGPKHLWSGDWESESTARNGGRADRTPAEDPTAGPNPAPPDPEPDTAKHRRNGLIAGGITVAVLAIVAIVIASSGGSNSPQAPTTAAGPGTATAQQTPTNPIPSVPTNPTQTTPTNPTQSTPTSPTPTTPTTPTTRHSAAAAAPTVPPRPITWLGMEVITVPNGTAVVDTVTPGGAGDLAGLNPADRISAINGHAVTGSSSIAKVVSGIHKGALIALTIDRGGTTLHPQAKFTGPPTPYP